MGVGSLSSGRRGDNAPAGGEMASDDLIEIEGVIKEVFPGGNFLVETEAGSEVHAHLAGKLRRFHIRVVLGDRVTVAVSPYDLTKGRIVFRHK
jgi:translation initiation factor IF-1